MTKDFKDFLAVVASCLLAILITIAFWIVRSHFNAKAYNKITHQNVTTWDAMWVELIVEVGPGDNLGNKTE